MASYLIIQTAFLGDVILSTVLVETIVRNDPEAKIDYVLKKGCEDLLKTNPHVRKLFIFDKNKKLRSLCSLILSIRKNHYEFTINVHRFFSSGLLTIFSKAKIKIGYTKNPLARFFSHSVAHDFDKKTHEVDRILALIKKNNFRLVRKPKLYYSEKQFAAISEYIKEPFVCIAPASVWKTKQAPIEKWIDIMKKHKTEKVFFIGGKKDSGLVEAIIQSSSFLKIASFNLCGKLSLLDSAALLSKAKHAYVNDSAPLHMCSANNTNVTVLYCSTSPLFGFGPLSENAEIIEVSNLACRPCGIHGHNACPKGHFKCGKDLIIP